MYTAGEEYKFDNKPNHHFVGIKDDEIIEEIELIGNEKSTNEDEHRVRELLSMKKGIDPASIRFKTASKRGPGRPPKEAAANEG